MSKSDESNEAREAIERLTGRLDLPKYIVEHAQFLDAMDSFVFTETVTSKRPTGFPQPQLMGSLASGIVPPFCETYIRRVRPPEDTE